MAELLDYLRQLNFTSMILRIALALLLGGVIGFDREKKGQPAGFRTYMLVAMGAAVTMILGQYLNLMIHTQWADAAEAVGQRTDVVRLGAQVINGIGFLGTGTILVTQKSQVKGLTTASGLWASACMGLAVGAGFYECTIIGFVMLFVSLKLLPLIEDAVLATAKNMNIYIELDSIENVGTVICKLKSRGILLYDVEINRENGEKGKRVNTLLSIRLPEKTEHTELLAAISTVEGVIAIDEI